MEETATLSEKCGVWTLDGDGDIAAKIRIKAQSYVEILLCLMLFAIIWYQTFPYKFGIFPRLHYLPIIYFVLYTFLQIVGAESFHFNKQIILIYFLYLCWFFMDLFSLYFSPYTKDVVEFIIFRLFYFLSFYIVTQFLQNERRMRLFEYFVLFAMIWNLPFVYWEVSTLQHFSTSRYYGNISYMPTGAFWSENCLASVLFMGVSVLLFIKGKYQTHISAFVIFLLTVINIIVGARLTILVLLVVAPIHFIKKTTMWYKVISILVISLVIWSVYSSNQLIREMAREHIRKTDFTFSQESESQFVTSSRQRMELMKSTLSKFGSTYGIGVGAGNINRTVTAEEAKQIGTETMPHNFFLEILGTEGLVGFILVSVIFFYPLFLIVVNRKSFWDLFRIKDYTEQEIQIIVFAVFFIFATTLVGSYRAYPFYSTVMAYHYCAYFMRTNARAPRTQTPPLPPLKEGGGRQTGEGELV